MGAAKRQLELMEYQERMAQEVAVEAGALSRCELHDDVLLAENDPDANKHAYALGTNLWKKGGLGKREEFMETVKRVIEEGGDECYSCAKNAAD